MATTTPQPYTVLPLLEAERVYIIGEYVHRDVLDRFIRLFVATWRRLPVDVWRAILEHWKPLTETRPACTPVRLIGRDWPASRTASGFVTSAGFDMGFDGQHFAGEFPPYAAEAIAHELAHVYQHATVSQREIDDEEADVERLQREWGFWFGPRGRSTPEHAGNAIDAAVEAL